MAESGEQQRKNSEDKIPAIVDLRYAIIGGVIATAVSIIGSILVGRMSAYKALTLVESLSSAVRFLGSGIMTACATILALMLTMLSLSSNLNIEGEFRDSHYVRIRQIALMCIIALMFSIFLLMVLSIPIKEAEEISGTWYEVIYYSIVITSSLTSGLFVTIILTLFNAIRGIVGIIHPGAGSDLIRGRTKSKQVDRGEER